MTQQIVNTTKLFVCVHPNTCILVYCECSIHICLNAFSKYLLGILYILVFTHLSGLVYIYAQLLTIILHSYVHSTTFYYSFKMYTIYHLLVPYATQIFIISNIHINITHGKVSCFISKYRRINSINKRKSAAYKQH